MNKKEGISIEVTLACIVIIISLCVIGWNLFKPFDCSICLTNWSEECDKNCECLKYNYSDVTITIFVEPMERHIFYDLCSFDKTIDDMQCVRGTDNRAIFLLNYNISEIPFTYNYTDTCIKIVNTKDVSEK